MRITRCRATGKARYYDRVAALLALATIQHKDGSHRYATEQRAYRCPQCKGWHLTHQPLNQNEAKS